MFNSDLNNRQAVLGRKHVLIHIVLLCLLDARNGAAREIRNESMPARVDPARAWKTHELEMCI